MLNDGQREADWYAKRCGAFTASRAGALMAIGKNGKPLKARQDLIDTLLTERLTGEPVEIPQTFAMARGLELEEEARNLFCFESNLSVQHVDYIPHATLEHVGCSPDGLIGDDGLVEIKCPLNVLKHLNAIKSGAHAEEYKWQVHFQLFVTDRLINHVVSYHPSFPEGLQLAVCTVERDPEICAQIEQAIKEADGEIEAALADIKRLAA